MQATAGEAAGRRGQGAGAHRLLVLLARLAQMDVDVDQPGRDDQPGGVDRLGALGLVDPAVDPGDGAVLDQQVEVPVQVLARIDRPGRHGSAGWACQDSSPSCTPESR